MLITCKSSLFIHKIFLLSNIHNAVSFELMIKVIAEFFFTDILIKPACYYIYILRKTIEGYYNSFDFITFEEIISHQSIFVSDGTTNMQCSKMQNAIYGSLVTIQYHVKCNNPYYRKVTRNSFCFYVFCCKPGLVIAKFLIPTTDLLSHLFITHCT